MQQYTAEEIIKHNDAGDLWLVLHGKVYDLTNFLKEHPGGEEVLINLAGQDGTQCFDDVGHSQEAKQLKDSYEIGVFQGSFINTSVRSVKQPEIDNEDRITSKPEGMTYLSILISLGIFIYAALFYCMFF